MEEGYRGHKPGSRKGTAHKIFDDKGPDAALEWGIANGLAAGTLRSWCTSWGKGVSAGARVALENGETSVVEPKGNIKVLWTKRPVRLVMKGDQCSEVKWLDTGSTQALSNDQINFNFKKSKHGD